MIQSLDVRYQEDRTTTNEAGVARIEKHGDKDSKVWPTVCWKVKRERKAWLLGKEITSISQSQVLVTPTGKRKAKGHSAFTQYIQGFHTHWDTT